MAISQFTVAVVEDHPGYRAFLCRTIEMFKGFKLLWEAADGVGCLENLEKSAKVPDIILVDIYMPVMNGYMLMRDLKKKYPFIKVLILSVESGDWSIIYMLTKGIRGYLLKIYIPELYDAMKQICQKGYYYSATAPKEMFDMVKSGELKTINISDREMQIIAYMASGNKSSTIASDMGIKKRTVDARIDMLHKKLDLHNQADLMMFAKHNSIIE